MGSTPPRLREFPASRLPPATLTTPSRPRRTYRDPAETHPMAPPPRPSLILLLTCVGAFMAPLDGSILAVALPQVASSLGLGWGATLWVQAAYLLAMAITLIPLGRHADHHGRLRGYLAGTAIFTVASLLAALSPDGAWLIAARTLQGLGGALLSATSAALVTEAFPPEQRGKALGLNVMAVYAGLSLGPPLGGFLVAHFGWRSLFLVNLPIGIVVFLLGRRLQRHWQETPGRGHALDLPGMALWSLGLAALLLPLTFAPEWGWGSWKVWLPLGLAALVAPLFLAVERRAPEPLLDLRLLAANRAFATGNLAALLAYMALYAVAMLTSVHLQLVQGRSVAAAGWIMLGQPLMQTALSPLAGRLSDRLGPRRLCAGGLAILALGMVWLALAPPGPLLGVLGGLALVGLGLAAFSAPNTSAVMGSVGRDRLAMASAFIATMRVTGMALSVSILGGLAASGLGAGGWRPLLGGSAPPAALLAFHRGYGIAMLTGAALALLGALVSALQAPRSRA